MPIRSFLARHRVLYTLLSTLLLASLLVGGFFLITSGREYTEDGLLQNSRVYITDAAYADGTVTYTLVNNTYKTKYYRSEAYIQRLGEDGTWSTALPDSGGKSQPRPAFSKESVSFEVVYPHLMTPGEYRLVLGNIRSAFKQVYVTGYFTVE